MENGTYGAANTNFEKYCLDKFPAHLFDSRTYAGAGCGANALALLTGISPLKIKKINKDKNHFSDSFILKFLRKNKFKVFKITKCNLTSRTRDSDLFYQIKDNHLLLVSQLINRNQATWIIYWNSIQYHNFELSKNDFWSLLNFPVSTAYVLYKEQWSKKCNNY